ncbi:hypothetical protein GCM10023340_22120 [Nocardioides marinquilinus]|uniref:DUF4439 domain-containing protein n=1 Tax=Nocardioides marinquilinus TaxID=1210400 RepID=A0ABP9PPX6_9ACTN
MSYRDALQTALAAEHAAVWVLGYLGAQTSASAEPTLYGLLQEAYSVHRDRRDLLEALVRDDGGDPVAAAPAYDVTDVDAAADPVRAVRSRALRLERDCGAAYGFVVANAPGERRGAALEALLDSALRELAFGGSPRRYPGR